MSHGFCREADAFLDYINGVLAFNPALATKKLPKTTAPLHQKIDFLKHGFGIIPELATLREKTPELITELKRIQTIRNDVVHGVSAERTPVAVRKVMRVKVKRRFLHETYKTYQLGEIAHAGLDAVELRNKLITLFADTMRVLDPERAKQFLSELPSFATASPPPERSGVDSKPEPHQGYLPKGLIVLLFVNALVGLVIGVTNASWLNVLLASLAWATALWLVITLMFGRASKSDKILFGSPTVTRFIVWWPMSFATSLIIASLIYSILAPS